MSIGRRSFLGLGLLSAVASAASAAGNRPSPAPPEGALPVDRATGPFLEDWRNGGGDPSDTGMIQRALAWAKSNGEMVRARAGRFIVEDEIDLFLAAPAKSWGLLGESWLSTIFECRFNGFDKAVFNGDSPHFETTGSDEGRSAGPIMDSVRVEFHPSVTRNPIGFSFQRVGNLRLSNYSVQGSNNCQVRLSNLTNSDCDNLVAFGGGWAWKYKSTSGITFDTTAGRERITASAPHFTPADVGRVLHIEDSVNAELFIIGSFVSERIVDATQIANRSFDGALGGWENAKCNTTAGERTVTAEDQIKIWTNDDTGREILIAGAAERGGILSARIESVVDGSTIVLDRKASTTVVDAHLAVPAVLFGGRSGIFNATNDFNHPNLQIEHFRGVGLACLFQTRSYFPAFKLHGEPEPHLSTPSTSALWVSGSGCHFPYGTLDSQTVGPAKIVAMGLNGALTFGRLDAIMSQGEKLCYERYNGNSGVVVFEGVVNVLNNWTAASRQAMFDNESSQKIFATEYVHTLGRSGARRLP